MTAAEYFKLQHYDRVLLDKLYKNVGNSVKLTEIMDKLQKLKTLNKHNFREEKYEDYL